MSEETWKDVEGFEGKYQISNKGRYRSLYKIHYAGGEKRKIYREKISIGVLRNTGYRYARLHNGGDYVDKPIHRFVAEAFIPNPENKPCVNHIDGNKLNNNVENLEWCTHQENMKHSADMGLWKYKGWNDGLNSPDTNFTREDILTIRSSGYSTKELSQLYGVNPSTINRIKAFQTFKDVN